MSPIPNVKLNDGNEIPVFGLGTWKSPPNAVRRAVVEAVKAGYRHIDCAHVYDNENEVGEALAELFQEGVVKREELFITSKLWNTSHSTHLVKPAIEKTLKELKVDYVDLYLIHWPFSFAEGEGNFPVDVCTGMTIQSEVDYLDTWKGMEGVKKAGLARSIGVSNFNQDQLERILANCEIPPAMVQIEIHPYLTQQKLIDFCRSKDIAITAYSPLGSPDRPWAKPGEPSLMEDPKVVKIAEKYGKSPAQVLIRFALDRGLIVIPKSVTKERIEDNMKVFDFKLTEAEVGDLLSFDRGFRFCALDWCKDNKNYPFVAAC